jgi:hypothetical protein
MALTRGAKFALAFRRLRVATHPQTWVNGDICDFRTTAIRARFSPGPEWRPITDYGVGRS